MAFKPPYAAPTTSTFHGAWLFVSGGGVSGSEVMVRM